MDRKEERAVVKRIKARDKLIQAGRTETAAWLAQRDDVRLLCEEHTQAEVGRMLGKAIQTKAGGVEACKWVSVVVRWKEHTSASPFARDAEPGRRDSVEQAEAKQVVRDPDKRKRLVGALTPDERQQLVQEVWNQEDQGKDPVLSPEQEEAFERREDEKKARQQIPKALWALRARREFYTDFPLDDNEKAYLPGIRRLVDALESGSEIDAELQEMIESARS